MTTRRLATLRAQVRRQTAALSAKNGRLICYSGVQSVSDGCEAGGEQRVPNNRVHLKAE